MNFWFKSCEGGKFSNFAIRDFFCFILRLTQILKLFACNQSSPSQRSVPPMKSAKKRLTNSKLTPCTLGRRYDSVLPSVIYSFTVAKQGQSARGKKK